MPGALGRFAAKLAAKKINVASAYQTIEKDSKKASVVLEVSHLDKALTFIGARLPNGYTRIEPAPGCS